jgi:hypothetical protein
VNCARVGEIITNSRISFIAISKTLLSVETLRPPYVTKRDIRLSAVSPSAFVRGGLQSVNIFFLDINSDMRKAARILPFCTGPINIFIHA